MIKILPVEKIREADAYTIKKEPIPSIDLMERAATQCFKWIKKRTDKNQKVKIFCGPGNNGGDGLVVARLLAEKHYEVEVFIVKFTNKFTEDFSINLKRLQDIGSVPVAEITENVPLPELNTDDLVLDAIFGSGLSRPVKGFIANVIRRINTSGAMTIAIDTPSGLFSDKNSTASGGMIIEADYTLSFQLPKYAFFFAENDKYVGEWHILPIGLMKEFIDTVDVKNFLIEKDDCSLLLKRRNKFAHKGNFGHALLISGSYGKMGAAVLAAQACIRSGSGLLTTHIPKVGYQIMQTAVPENMLSIDDSEEVFSKTPDLSFYNAIAVGPGLGKNKSTQNALKLLIQNSSIPIIFDADAINILGENKTWIPFIPKGSILTPHPKEFERIAGKSSDNFERNKLQREFSIKNQVYVILKGAFTCITTPRGQCFFNPTGNPGMATGGSGDVLTGILLGLKAQNYSSFNASALAVYLHGSAGDIAAKKYGYEAMKAGDIVECLGKAFKKLL